MKSGRIKSAGIGKEAGKKMLTNIWESCKITSVVKEYYTTDMICPDSSVGRAED